MRQETVVRHLALLLLLLTVAACSLRDPTARAEGSAARGKRQQTVEQRLEALEVQVLEHNGLIEMLQFQLANEGIKVASLENEVAGLRANNTALADQVEQQAAQVLLLQAGQGVINQELSQLQGDVADLQAGNSGTGSTPQVAFTARFEFDDSLNGVPLPPRDILKFDWVSQNAGQGYNASTGRFTAPVGGLYVFHLTTMAVKEVQGDPSVLELAIATPDLVLGIVAGEATSERGEQGSTQVAARLAAGEQVWVRQELGHRVRGSWWTVFTGYLLRADSGQAPAQTQAHSQPGR